MPKLKAQFHVHTKQDPHDNIRHTEKQKIDHAAKLGYDVMAISCHNVVIFNDDLQKYAENKRILLIPAIEKSVERKHVLILNATIEAQNIHTFNDLRLYKKKNPDSFIVAVHPYYPGSISLRKKLEEHIDIFDAIEYNWYHSKRINHYNKKAIKMAEKHNLPVIGTSDNHLLRFFDKAYSIVDADRNLDSVLKALRDKKVNFVSHGITVPQLIQAAGEVMVRNLVKRATLR